jgi:hypothetical protein
MENTNDDPLTRKAGNTDEEESERLLQLSNSLTRKADRLDTGEALFFERHEHVTRRIERARAWLKRKAKITKMKQVANEAFRLHRVLRMQLLCRRLQRNDPNVQRIDRGDCSGAPADYVHQLGSALKENTNVRFLFVQLIDWKHCEDHYLAYEQTQKFTEPMLVFVATSSALRTVELASCATTTTSWISAFFAAIASNPSIEELQLSSVKIGGDELCHLMSTTVKRLYLTDIHNLNDGDDEQDKMAKLEDSFRSLESLALESVGGAVTLQILHGLKGNAALREMELSGSSMRTLAHWNALSGCLRTTPALRHLKLKWCDFYAEQMQAFLNCLLQRDPAETNDLCASIVKLSLEDCYMNLDAIDLFGEFMQTESCSVGHAPLRELSLDDPAEDAMTRFFEKLLLTPSNSSESTHNNGGLTIGTQLTALSLRGGDCCNGFLAALAGKPSKSKLDTLRLTGVAVAECKMLKKNVAHLRCLRDLHLADIEDPLQSSQIILDLLRESEGLYSFNVENDTDVPLFDAATTRLAEAFCLRNQHLPELLECAQSVGHENGLDLEARRSLYPYLLRVIMNRPPSCHVALSTSLMKCGDSIGPTANRFALLRGSNEFGDEMVSSLFRLPLLDYLDDTCSTCVW